ncbi:LacI family DNA-binding transcriptional regulator [Motilibacter aurantiacus]|uniref:LacI family DNA-binding transcriptional regulator n=1 Tax=Motilibacter aurantiacus TaxID=2714955 RepID=UPI002F2B648B
MVASSGSGSSSRDGAPAVSGRPANIWDVAKAAGVSHQTVSRVLNDSPSVRPATRERVLVAIDELGYRRNPAARALVTRRSQTLGVVSFDTTLYGPASTLYGIEQSAREAGYFVSVASLKSIDVMSMRDALERLAEQSVDGLVVIAPLREAGDALAELRGKMPVVVVEGGSAPGLASVSVDQVDGGRLATRHLLEQGAETVHHVSGPADWLESEGRIAGWLEELERAGAAPPELLQGSWSPSSGYSAGRELARMKDVSAVFVANDQMSLGLLRAFHEEGIRVPQDVLVAGFDDVPEAAYYTPPLTTVRQDFAQVGRRSIQLLLEQIAEGRAHERHAVVPVELVVRQSSVRSSLQRQHLRARSSRR